MNFDIITIIVSAASSSLPVIFWLGPKMKKISLMLKDWNGEPPRPGFPGRMGVMERLENIEHHSNLSAYNTTSNGGNSAYDAHTRMLADIHRRVMESE